MAILSAQGLSFTYAGADQPTLREVDLQIEPGEFVLLCGASGSGKTTLLRQWKLPPAGKTSGNVCYDHRPCKELPRQVVAREIGFLFQSPEHQMVTDTVCHELAFGLENLGCPPEQMRLRVAEVAQYFGIHNWHDKKTDQLSGGQKQIVNLAGLLAMHPKVLLLDEPTAQLDPVLRRQFLCQLQRINIDLGITILLCEHNLEQSLELADRVVVLEGGRICHDGSPRQVGRVSELFEALPTPAKVQAAVQPGGKAPLSVKEGRLWLEEHRQRDALCGGEPPALAPPALIGKNLCFGYDKEPLLQDLSIAVPRGSIYALVGGNGSGKSTLISLLGGVSKPWRGRVEPEGITALLPQDAQTLFAHETVAQELKQSRALGWETLASHHPYDLSVGEQQGLALEIVLQKNPDILLLDEPTKGLDAARQKRLGERLTALKRQGKTIVFASHNLEFCARYADTCGLLFGGQLVSTQPPHPFFAGQAYYTTVANQMARHIDPLVILWEEAVGLCQPNDEC